MTDEQIEKIRNLRFKAELGNKLMQDLLDLISKKEECKHTLKAVRKIMNEIHGGLFDLLIDLDNPSIW